MTGDIGNRCAGHMGNILVDHPNVAEAAVIGKQHEIKGQAICAFVSLKAGIQNSPANRGKEKGTF